MISIRLFCVLLTTAVGLFAQTESRFSAERLERMKSVLSERIAHHDYTGGNALILCNGQTVFAESFGYQDVAGAAPMQADTLFSIASMTKPITAVAVMMLYEQGKFLLDEPVSKYLPAFAEVHVLAKEGGDQNETVPAKTPITIRHLLTHTSGLFNFAGYKAAGINLQMTLEETVNKIATAPLSHQPGEGWRYGLSYDVLARLVEVCSGQSFASFVETNILQPLGMKDAGYFVPSEQAHRVAEVYRINAEGKLEALPNRTPLDHLPAFVGGSGGIYCTIGDFGRFSQMLLNGGELDGHRLLSPATVEYMLMSQVPENVMPVDGPNGRKGFGMGLGGYVLVDQIKSENLGIAGEYNGAGVFGTYYWIDPKNKLAGLWFSQRFPQVQSELHRFKVLTYQALVN